MDAMFNGTVVLQQLKRIHLMNNWTKFSKTPWIQIQANPTFPEQLVILNYALVMNNCAPSVTFITILNIYKRGLTVST